MSTQRDLAQTRFERMTRVLRTLGAVLLLSSASSFLIHRWSGGNDLLRFGFLLAHSFVVLGSASFCGGKLGESRSARLFLWLNLALVPVHFAVLGALFYSQFAWDSAELSLPSFAIWHAPNRASVLMVAACTFPTVILTSLVSTRVLAPKRARLVTATYVGVCSLLLVPCRGPEASAVLSTLGAGVCLFAERKWFRNDYRMRTLEGRLVRTLLAVPTLFIVSRAAIFYPQTPLFFGLLTMILALCGWVFVRGAQSESTSEAGEWATVVLGLMGLFLVLDGLRALAHFGVLALLAHSAALLLASRFSRFGRSRFEQAAVASALVFSALALVLGPTLLQGALVLSVGAMLLTLCVLLGRTILGVASSLVTLAGICVVFDKAVGFEHLSNWGTLSVLGVVVVIGAAFAERHREFVVAALEKRIKNDTPPGSGESLVLEEPDTCPQADFPTLPPSAPRGAWKGRSGEVEGEAPVIL